MKLIAAGRASEILDLGDGTVLRRFKDGGNPEREALVMGHALAAGYPVPRVAEVRADSLVLERIEGRSLLAEVFRRRWAIIATSGGGLLAWAFLRRFLSRFDRDEVVAALPQAAELRIADFNVRDDAPGSNASSSARNKPARNSQERHSS